MNVLCTDNRFELIEKYKAKLIESTNIEDAQDEMSVIDDILFRFWQMGWLDKLDADAAPVVQATWERIKNNDYGIDFRCSACHRFRFHNGELRRYKYCPNCGAKMDGGKDDADK